MDGSFVPRVAGMRGHVEEMSNFFLRLVVIPSHLRPLPNQLAGSNISHRQLARLVPRRPTAYNISPLPSTTPPTAKPRPSVRLFSFFALALALTCPRPVAVAAPPVGIYHYAMYYRAARPSGTWYMSLFGEPKSV